MSNHLPLLTDMLILTAEMHSDKDVKTALKESSLPYQKLDGLKDNLEAVLQGLKQSSKAAARQGT